MASLFVRYDMSYRDEDIDPYGFEARYRYDLKYNGAEVTMKYVCPDPVWRKELKESEKTPLIVDPPEPLVLKLRMPMIKDTFDINKKHIQELCNRLVRDRSVCDHVDIEDIDLFYRYCIEHYLEQDKEIIQEILKKKEVLGRRR